MPRTSDRSAGWASVRVCPPSVTGGAAQLARAIVRFDDAEAAGRDRFVSTLSLHGRALDGLPLGDVFDDFNEFVDAVPVVAGEGDELPRALDNRA
jgi:hypothetical protein